MAMFASGEAGVLHLSALAHELGAAHDIATLPQVSEDPDLGETLRHLGLATFRRAAAPLLDLVEASCRKTIEQDPGAREQIGAFILATSSLGKPDTYQDGFRQLHARLGLRRAIPIGLFGSECSNLGTAIGLAVDMIRAGRISTALVVTADIADDRTRIMPGLASVYSDGAASCLVGRASGAGLQLEALSLHSSVDMARIDPRGNVLAYLRGSMNGALAAVRACLAECHGEISQFRRIVLGNYNQSVLNTYATQLQVSPRDIYGDNVATVGHCYSADLLVNAKRLLDEDLLRDNERTLWISSGHNTWGAMAIRRCGVA